MADWQSVNFQTSAAVLCHLVEAFLHYDIGPPNQKIPKLQGQKAKHAVSGH